MHTAVWPLQRGRPAAVTGLHDTPPAIRIVYRPCFAVFGIADYSLWFCLDAGVNTTSTATIESVKDEAFT